jgi:hypothetical protein
MIRDDQDAALFFQTHFVMWAVGLIEPDFVAELDALTPPTQENWRQIMERQCPWTRAEIQAAFTKLCVEMTDDEALDVIMRELSLAAT